MLALYVASRDPRTPWPARIMALLVTAYALSPIDLIPDFIPVIGLLDDLLIVPLGIWLVLRMLPADLLAAYRDEATELGESPRSFGGAILVVTAWLIGALALVAWFHA